MRYAAGVLAAMLTVTATALAQAQGEYLSPIPDADEIIASCQATYKNKDA